MNGTFRVKLYILFLVFSVCTVGCSKQLEVEGNSEVFNEVERIELNESNLMTEDQYVIDGMSRLTVLVQCEKFYNNNKNIPHCINAQAAEKKAIYLDLLGQAERLKGKKLSSDEIEKLKARI